MLKRDLLLAALHHAAERGHTEIVGQLVIAGANVQRVDLRGFTSAHLAASQGHIDVLEKLLMAGKEQELSKVPLCQAQSTESREKSCVQSTPIF